MNNLKRIADEFVAQVNNMRSELIEDVTKDSQTFLYFRSISGFLNDMYFDVHFIEHEKGVEIKLSPTTDCETLVKHIIGNISTDCFVYTRAAYQIA